MKYACHYGWIGKAGVVFLYSEMQSKQ